MTMSHNCSLETSCSDVENGWKDENSHQHINGNCRRILTVQQTESSSLTWSFCYTDIKSSRDGRDLVTESSCSDICGEQDSSFLADKVVVDLHPLQLLLLSVQGQNRDPRPQPAEHTEQVLHLEQAPGNCGYYSTWVEMPLITSVTFLSIWYETHT